MLDVTRELRSVTTSMRAAGRDLRQYNGLGSMGHLQDAKDSLTTARDEYSHLSPPSSYAWVNWEVGQSLAKYSSGIDEISRSIANQDPSEFESGLTLLTEGDSALKQADRAFYRPRPKAQPTPAPLSSSPQSA